MKNEREIAERMLWEKTRLDQSNVLDWKVSYILWKYKFILSHENLNWVVKNWQIYEWTNPTIKREYVLTLPLTLNVNVTFMVTWYFIWPQSRMDYPDHSDQIVAQSNENKGDIRNWKFSDVMSVRPEVT